MTACHAFAALGGVKFCCPIVGRESMAHAQGVFMEKVKE